MKATVGTVPCIKLKEDVLVVIFGITGVLEDDDAFVGGRIGVILERKGSGGADLKAFHAS
jgi:hypothetical protein